MIKHLCWICGKEIISHEEYQERNLTAGIRVEEICKECGRKLGELVEQLKKEKQNQEEK